MQVDSLATSLRIVMSADSIEYLVVNQALD